MWNLTICLLSACSFLFFICVCFFNVITYCLFNYSTRVFVKYHYLIFHSHLRGLWDLDKHLAFFFFQLLRLFYMSPLWWSAHIEYVFDISRLLQPPFQGRWAGFFAPGALTCAMLYTIKPWLNQNRGSFLNQDWLLLNLVAIQRVPGVRTPGGLFDC